MTHEERLPPDEADVPDDITYNEDNAEVVWYDEADGTWWGEDHCGEFRLTGGSKRPLDEYEDDLSYAPCNAVLKHTWRRYGERRFCASLAGPKGAEKPRACNNHQCRISDGYQELYNELMITGATAQSHENIFRFMDAHKQVLANDLYKSLLSESSFDFELENYEMELDTSDASFIDADEITVNHPIPNEHEIRCKALWYAALDFVTMESIREEQFRTAYEEDEVNAVGQEWAVVASGDSGAVYDTDEHHLNLPLSRIQKDYKEHLKFGGVNYEPASESSSDDMTEQEWVINVEPSEDTAVPKTKESHASSPMDDIEVPDADK